MELIISDRWANQRGGKAYSSYWEYFWGFWRPLL